jgi:hypothetical protein
LVGVFPLAPGATVIAGFAPGTSSVPYLRLLLTKLIFTRPALIVMMVMMVVIRVIVMRLVVVLMRDKPSKDFYFFICVLSLPTPFIAVPVLTLNC